MADKKPLLAMLGFGAARKAGEQLSERDKKLQEQLEEAESGVKKKKRSEELGINTDP